MFSAHVILFEITCATGLATRPEGDWRVSQKRATCSHLVRFTCVAERGIRDVRGQAQVMGCPDMGIAGEWEVAFGESYADKGLKLTKLEIRGSSWGLLDYGDTIPIQVDGPTNDVSGEVMSERNQCLSIHMAACFIYGPMGRAKSRTRTWKGASSNKPGGYVGDSSSRQLTVRMIWGGRTITNPGSRRSACSRTRFYGR